MYYSELALFRKFPEGVQGGGGYYVKREAKLGKGELMPPPPTFDKPVSDKGLSPVSDIGLSPVSDIGLSPVSDTMPDKRV